jgi:hypothetical protein
MRSQLPLRLGIARSLVAQAAASAPNPDVQVKVKFVLVPQSKICDGPYKPGCPVTREAESLKEKWRISRLYSLSKDRSVPLPLEPDFQSALTSCIDDGNYVVLLEFDWKVPLVAFVDMVSDSGERLSQLANSHRQFGRSQASPYSPNAPDRSNAGGMMRAGPLWFAYRNAIDFEPDKNAKWKLILNDAWYGFYVKSAP